MSGVTPSREFNDQLVKTVKENRRGRRSTAFNQARHIPPGAQLRMAKCDAAISKGAWGSVTLWSGPLGNESATSITVDALNRFGDIEGPSWLLLLRIGGGWLIMMAECI